MRHGKKINHLGRTSSHRKAMMANMASSLIKHKRITTTVAKAKALRTYVEPLLTRGKSNTTHNMRTVFAYLGDKDAVKELFTVVGEKIANRPGGYTRILKTGNRMGDNADMAMIELVDFNEYFTGFGKKKDAGSKRTRRGRGKTTTEATAARVAAPAKEVAVEEVAEVVAEETAAPVAEVQTAEVVAETPAGDNLEDINGIGPAFAQRLNALGIHTFADLAALTEEKIAELEQQDSMTSPEEWQNWISEAKSRIA
ncbi:MAG: 50S ribosomal protein L17 [Bacteroidetes bacterium]|nr:50S ribosomal protein L17 [Bacteroidota bacterium]